ncbi:MAG: zinc ribbon domain-containing protein [Promethearchaeota archaeon]
MTYSGGSYYQRVSFTIRGHDYSSGVNYDSFNISPFFWFFITLFYIGFFLNFGYIKEKQDNQILKNLGFLSGILVLISIIGILTTSISTAKITYPGLTESIYSRSVTATIDLGFYSGIILVLFIFLESILQNYTNILQKDKLVKEEHIIRREREISGKVFCSSCGAEIVDATGDFCSKCGAPLK